MSPPGSSRASPPRCCGSARSSARSSPCSWRRAPLSQGRPTRAAQTVAGSLAYALAEGLLVAVAVVLTVYAASGRFAGWPWLLGVPLGITLVIGALIGLSL